MNAIHLRLTLFLFGLVCHPSQALSIRKRSINSDELVSDGQLLHAIDVIERAKLQRRPAAMLNEELLGELPSNEDEVVDDLLQASYDRHRAEDDDLDLERDTSSIDDGGGNDEGNDVDSLRHKEEKRVVDKDELENIFKQSAGATPRENRSIVTKTETIQVVPLAEKEKMFQEEVATIIDRANEEVRSTLAPAGNVVEIEKIVRTETKPEEGKTVIKTETTDWELSPRNNLELDTNEDENLLAPDTAEANKEWLLNLVEQNDLNGVTDWRNKKAKRSEKSSENDEQREKIRNTAVELLKAYMEEQEEEKRHLSRALNLATMAQVERTDRYVPGEISEIKQAVKDEQLIQALRNVIANKEVNNENEDENFDNGIEERAEEKRSGYYQSNREWLPEHSYSNMNDEEEESERVVDDFVKDRLNRYVLENSRNDVIADDDEEEEDVDTSLSNRELAEERDQYRLNPFLREVESVDGSARVGEKRSDDSDDSQEECPEVDDMVDNCAAARERGLLLDDEAVDLCNRHQLCYECGPYYGMTADSCDRGYMGAAHLACSHALLDEGKCHAQALELYSIMFNSHEFAGELSSYQCTAPCVYDYIVNSERG